MSERHDNQNNSNSSIRKLLQERIEEVNPRLNLTAEEAKRLAKLEAMADKLTRRENVQSGCKFTHKLHTHYASELSTW